MPDLGTSRAISSPLDIVIGSLESRGNFCLYHVDSRRFEPAPAEVLQPLAGEKGEE